MTYSCVCAISGGAVIIQGKGNNLVKATDKLILTLIEQLK